MKAKDKREYLDAWNKHITELNSVAFDAEWQHGWIELRNQLWVMVNDAANMVFGEDDGE